jgi:hypothetical protein
MNYKFKISIQFSRGFKVTNARVLMGIDEISIMKIHSKCKFCI